MSFSGPGLGKARIREIVQTIVKVVTIPVDRNPVGLTRPCADRGFQIVHIIVHIDDGLHPVGHFGRQTATGDIAFKRRPHFDNVEIHCLGGDRLLQTRVIVGLSQIDPFDLGAGIFLPRLQETAEQEVVKVLVVQAHEGQLDPGKFAFLNNFLGRPQRHFADLLPIGIGW